MSNDNLPKEKKKRKCTACDGTGEDQVFGMRCLACQGTGVAATPTADEGGEAQLKWQLCPKCQGQGKVSKPPWLPAEVIKWSSTSVSFECDVCQGNKVIPWPVTPSSPTPPAGMDAVAFAEWAVKRYEYDGRMELWLDSNDNNFTTAELYTIANPSGQPAVRMDDGWISVEDRLPDYGYCNVAYFNPSDKYKKLYVITVCRGRDGWYWDNSEKEPAEDETLKVTHWRPLPAPPASALIQLNLINHERSNVI